MALSGQHSNEVEAVVLLEDKDLELAHGYFCHSLLLRAGLKAIVTN